MNWSQSQGIIYKHVGLPATTQRIEGKNIQYVAKNVLESVFYRPRDIRKYIEQYDIASALGSDIEMARSVSRQFKSFDRFQHSACTPDWCCWKLAPTSLRLGPTMRSRRCEAYAVVARVDQDFTSERARAKIQISSKLLPC